MGKGLRQVQSRRPKGRLPHRSMGKAGRTYSGGGVSGLRAPLEARLFSPLQGVELLQTAALLGVLLLGFGYFWLLVPDLEARLQQLGLFCSVFTISMYLSPLTDLVSGSGSVPGGGGDKKGPPLPEPDTVASPPEEKGRFQAWRETGQ